jgi:hypothetical protein
VVGGLGRLLEDALQRVAPLLEPVFLAKLKLNHSSEITNYFWGGDKNFAICIPIQFNKL